jgi:hypothetical protein
MLWTLFRIIEDLRVRTIVLIDYLLNCVFLRIVVMTEYISWCISAVQWSRGRKLEAGSSGTAGSVNPTTVVASDEAAAATFHLSNGRTSTGDPAWVAGRRRRRRRS